MKKPLNLPPEVAQAFVADMREFFAERSIIRQDEIAARQLAVLRSFQGPREKKLKVSDVKKMFLEMRDQDD